MTERLNTTDVTAASASFQPAADFSVQVEIAEGSAAAVYVMGRVDAAAPWLTLGRITRQTVPPIRRFAKCPIVRIDMAGNLGGKTVKAWSGE